MNTTDDQTAMVAEAIAAAGGNSKVARELGLTSPESVRVWTTRGIPAEHVLGLARLTGWKYRPHDLAPDLYPHHDDGMPVDRRSSGEAGGLAAAAA